MDGADAGDHTLDAAMVAGAPADSGPGAEEPTAVVGDGAAGAATDQPAYAQAPPYPPPAQYPPPPQYGPTPQYLIVPVVPPPGGWQPASAPPPYGPRPYVRPASGNATIALVLAIVSYASWAICPWLGATAAAIVSLVFAAKAAREIAASGGEMSGGGMVLAARIMSWISLGLVIATFVLFIVLMIVAGSGGSQPLDTTYPETSYLLPA